MILPALKKAPPPTTEPIPNLIDLATPLLGAHLRLGLGFQITLRLSGSVSAVLFALSDYPSAGSILTLTRISYDS